MALTATIYNFDIELADGDRGVYESLAVRVAQHPSELREHLVARRGGRPARAPRLARLYDALAC